MSRTILFQSAHGALIPGEVWRNIDGNYGSINAGHSLCVEMARHIEQLTAQRDAAEAELERVREQLNAERGGE